MAVPERWQCRHHPMPMLRMLMHQMLLLRVALLRGLGSGETELHVALLQAGREQLKRGPAAA